MLRVYTAQYRYSGPDRLDITVKGNDPLGKFFAPTWGLVGNLKNGIIDEHQYEMEYRDLMLNSWNTYQDKWQELLKSQEVTLVCFCPAGTFCHRVLLAGYLQKVEAIYLGERNLKR